MNILIVARGYFDKEAKVGNFELDQALALKKIGYNVKILAIDIRSILHGEKKYGYINFENNGIEVYGFRFSCGLFPELLKRKISQIGVNHLFEKIYEKWKPNIIHAHFGYIGFSILKIVNKYKIKFILTEHYSGMNKINPKKSLLYICNKTYKKADKLLSVSTCLQKNIKENTGYNSIVVPNMLDSTIDYEKQIINNIKENINIISAGNLTKNKNFELLIKSLSQIKINYKLRIFGSGTEKKIIKKLIKDYNLEDKINLFDKISRNELFENYRNSDCFILLSKSETFGLVYIEAMSCGLPVLSLNCGGTNDFINEKVGVIIQNSNIENISHEIDEFLKNLDKYDKNYIKNYAYNNYNSKVVALKIKEIYENI